MGLHYCVCSCILWCLDAWDNESVNGDGVNGRSRNRGHPRPPKRGRGCLFPFSGDANSNPPSREREKTRATQSSATARAGARAAPDWGSKRLGVIERGRCCLCLYGRRRAGAPASSLSPKPANSSPPRPAAPGPPKLRLPALELAKVINGDGVAFLPFGWGGERGRCCLLVSGDGVAFLPFRVGGGGGPAPQGGSGASRRLRRPTATGGCGTPRS
jgi:hypothetical protein